MASVTVLLLSEDYYPLSNVTIEAVWAVDKLTVLGTAVTNNAGIATVSSTVTMPPPDPPFPIPVSEWIVRPRVTRNSGAVRDMSLYGDTRIVIMPGPHCATFTVSQDGDGTDTTISSAIAKCVDPIPYIIEVMPGIYEETLDFSTSGNFGSIALVACPGIGAHTYPFTNAGAGSFSTIVAPPEPGTVTTVLINPAPIEGARPITFTGFAFSNPSGTENVPTIRHMEGRVAFRYCLIENAAITQKTALKLESGGGEIQLQNCTIIGDIEMTSISPPSFSMTHSFLNGRIFGLWSDDNLMLIESNYISTTSSSAAIDMAAGLNSPQGIRIIGNRIEQSGTGAGILLSGAGSNDGTIIIGNQLRCFELLTPGTGINITVPTGTVTGNTLEGWGTAINVGGSGIIVLANHYRNNTTAITGTPAALQTGESSH